MGYNNLKLRNGADIFTPCFDKIGVSKTIDLTELIPSGYDEVSGDEIYLDILNNDGTTDKQFAWFDIPGDFDAGWYLDYEPVSKGDQMFEAGDGAWITGVDNYILTVAGQVIEKGRAISLRDGAIPLGNLLARTIDLNELKPSGYEEVSGDEVYIDILNNDGTTKVQYAWFDIPGDFEPGWYLDYEPVLDGDQTFEPGAGMWVTGLTGYSLEFPDL